MGQIDFNTYKQSVRTQSAARTDSGNNRPYVSYFSLKDDGDSAIVRILVDSPDQLNIVGLHRESIMGRNRAVSCMRRVNDPPEACPFCAAGEKLLYHVFIPVLEYQRNDNNEIVATPKIWERSISYVDIISNLIDNYGPLSTNIFKIVRRGAAGSRDTRYDIVYCIPTVYKPELYPMDEKAFEGYKVLGTAVLEVNEEEALQILQGETPERLQPRPATDSPREVNTEEYTQPSSAPVSESRSVNPYPSQGTTTNPGTPPARPRRYYS